jgi:7-cyano-7-deazaguanine reductase
MAAAAPPRPPELAGAPLGAAAAMPEAYAPQALFAVARAPQRAKLGIEGEPPFRGVDLWTAYELTWLDSRGKPQVAMAVIEIPARSPSIVESKSMKLYLGSFAHEAFDDAASLAAIIARDLGKAAGAPVGVTLEAPGGTPLAPVAELEGSSLDTLDIACSTYDVDPGLLHAPGERVAETLRTDLFRSTCPVTGQPDMGSVQVMYEGPAIDRSSLLCYLVSYRRHCGFHEQCVERIFMDLKARCRCERLSVYARFLRRGGIDINPFRTDAEGRSPARLRAWRQ